MSHKSLTTWQKATALVPLALLSGAWTMSLTTTSSASPAAPERNGTTTLPDGTTVPDRALEAPASVSQPGSLAPGVPEGTAQQIVAEASTNGIPAVALAAYQRAEQVINAADKSCNLSWQLVAAIGKVESDHGRYGGNALGEDGKANPGIYGIPLDGSNGTAAISDTDAGELDGDPVFDRAVGPMQFIPSTWSIVGVDADGDGSRDPQDIHDAALATAVYLCSGDEDLSTYGGQKAAVYRYNHSEEYVDLVLSIMNAYLDGDYSAVPNGLVTTPVLTPNFGYLESRAANAREERRADRERREQRADRRRDRDGRGGGAAGGGSAGGGAGGSGDGGGSTGGSPLGGSPIGGGDPVRDTTEAVKDTVTDTVDKTTDPVRDTTKKVTDGVGDATEKVTDGVGDATEKVTDGLTDGVGGAVEDTVGGLTGGLG
jgi:membrane-bound lytic murein transglycosylase B